jgi:hypothetical protein
MHDNAFVQKLDEIIRSCKEQIQKLSHIDRLLSKVLPNDTQAQNGDDNAAGNRNIGSVSSIRNTPNQTQQNKPRTKEDSWNLANKIQVFLATFTFLAVASGVWSNVQTRQLVATTQDQFIFAKLDRRAWIQVKDDAFLATKIDDIKYFQFPVYIQNFGKSPANKIVIVSAVDLPMSNEAPSFDYSRAISGSNIPMFPGSPEKSVVVRRLNPNNPRSMAPQEMTPDLMSDLQNGRRYIVVFGRITYEDVVGSWWTDFCFWNGTVPNGTQATFNSSTCIDYNSEGGSIKQEDK